MTMKARRVTISRRGNHLAAKLRIPLRIEDKGYSAMSSALSASDRGEADLHPRRQRVAVVEPPLEPAPSPANLAERLGIIC
jgi:hypothetical protein